MGLILFFILRSAARLCRPRPKPKPSTSPFKQTTGIATEAAKVDSVAAAEARDRRVKDARKKRDTEVAAAKEKARAQQLQLIDQHRTNTADETRRSKERDRGSRRRKNTCQLAELEQNREKMSQQIEQENTETRQGADAQHAAAVQALESRYQNESRDLETRWNDGLRTLTELMAVDSGIDPHLIDWTNPAWAAW